MTLNFEQILGPDDHIRHVRAAALIGISVGLLFPILNILTVVMLPLGLAELAAVVVAKSRFLASASYDLRMHWGCWWHAVANELESLDALLIKEDELRSAALSGLLRSRGCRVCIAGNGQQACLCCQTGSTGKVT